MSADNWAICPKCTEENRKSFAEKEESLQAKYGTIPAEEFTRLSRELASSKELTAEETLREDYGIGIYSDDGGTFSISYFAHCSVCGFSYKFSYELPHLIFLEEEK